MGLPIKQIINYINELMKKNICNYRQTYFSFVLSPHCIIIGIKKYKIDADYSLMHIDESEIEISC